MQPIKTDMEKAEKVSVSDLDKVLGILYESQHVWAMSNLYKEAFGLPIDLRKINIILDKLDRDKFITSDDILYVDTDEGKKSLRSYCISFEGIIFFESAHFICQNKPYRWKINKGIIKTIWDIAKIIMIFLNAVAILYLMYLLIPK